MSENAQPRPFIVSWDEMHRNAKELARRLHDRGPWKGIVAITRGGMVPAAIIARELDLRIVETVSVAAYESSDGSPSDIHAEIQIIKPPAGVGDGEGWLVIDELVDTGRTLEVLRKLLPKAHYAAIYAKPMGMPLVDAFVTEVSQDSWIYLPWDIELQFAQPIAAQPQGQRTK